MKLEEYHTNLSKWFRQYILDLTHDIKDEDVWKKFENINSPGWTLLHLIIECELALVKLKPDYEIVKINSDDFTYGSSGYARSEMTISEMHNRFINAYQILESEVSKNLDTLYKTEIRDELLKDVLKTELDSYLHLLTTHVAMHCDALIKWRKQLAVNS